MSDPLTASPLRPEQLSRLRSLIQEFSADQLLWVSGYLAGLTAGQQTHSGAAGIAAPEKVTVLYASQTGNAQKLAGLLHQRLVTTGCSVQLQTEYRSPSSLGAFLPIKNWWNSTARSGGSPSPCVLATRNKYFSLFNWDLL